MNILQEKNGNALTIALEGRLDTMTAPELEAVLGNALKGVTELTFDFEKLEYISSAGLRVLLAAQMTMNAQGTMKVLHINEIVAEIFESGCLMMENMRGKSLKRNVGSDYTELTYMTKISRQSMSELDVSQEHAQPISGLIRSSSTAKNSLPPMIATGVSAVSAAENVPYASSEIVWVVTVPNV